MRARLTHGLVLGGLILGASSVMALGGLATATPQIAGAAGATAATPSKTSFKRAKVTITDSKVAGSGMKKVLTDKAGYALYIFANDRPSKKRSSRCYGKCAKDWPPLLTRRKPVARGGAKQGKLGVTKRRDGKKQVTYGGRPVYYYAHEPEPAFVGCHDVNLNGGFWYAIRASGKRLP